MNEKSSQEPNNEPSLLSRQIGTKASRKLKARRNPTPGVWYGLGMMGLIGWSIAVPTLLGASLGMWLDKQHLSDRSWTLALLVTGLTIGCLNAWLWVSREQNAIREDDQDDVE
jgi:ATP synthase protein I